jgi:lysophospholipase L1-like esterase
MITWIIGDSIINWAGENQMQLQGGGRVIWNGIGGARIAGVCNRLNRCLKNQMPCPSSIILHLGTNDIFAAPIHIIRQRIEQNLLAIRNLFPLTRIIWSLILPRFSYRGEARKGAGNACARNINMHAIRFGKSMSNVHVISHTNLFSKDLFKKDGVHLKPEGLTRFRLHFESALIFFNGNPDAYQFPIPK